MSGYRELSEPTRSGEGEWVDFPASSDPDPWAALLRKANRLAPILIETQQGENGSLPGRTPMVTRKPSDHPAMPDHGLLRHHFSFGDAKGAAMTSLAVALRGLLVTTIAVTIVAFLLLTNSHI
jgi:hypothetical protein